MPRPQPIIEDGVIAGNLEDKYASKNPIARALMHGFLSNVANLVQLSGCHEALEVGCGEGLLSIELQRRLGLRILGTDFSTQVIDVAKRNAIEADADVTFEVGDIYRLPVESHRRPLVVCCEVLEHLEEPERALQHVCALAERYLVLSVPREPLWRGLNLMRGKYVSALGNTPGHLQHWSQRAFVELVRRYANIVELRTPIPWTMLLATPKR